MITPALVLAAASAVGLGLDRLLHFQTSAMGAVPRWAGRALASLAVLFVWVLWPPFAILLLAGLLVAARGAVAEPATTPASVTTPAPQWWLVTAALIVLAVIVASRGTAMIYWDENTHMARAAWGAAGLSQIRRLSLDPSPVVLQRGYPIFWPVVVAALSGQSSAPAPLLAAAATALFVFGALFIGLSADHFRGSRLALLPIAGLVLTPLALVHARSAYADLPLGLLTACWAMLLSRGRVDAMSILLGVSLAGLKDEGIAVALAGTIAFAVLASRAGQLRQTAIRSVGVATVFVPIAIWKWWFPSSGVASAGHTLAAVHWDRTGDVLLGGFFRHGTDVDSWGLVWPLLAGALLSTPWTWARLRPDARFLALFATLHLAALVSAIVVAPADVIDHVTVQGFVANRLLIQALPSVVVLLTCFVRDLSQAPAAQAAALRGSSVDIA